MEKNFNLSSLSTVYAPIEEYLKSIRIGLQENLNTVKNDGKLATNFEYIDTLTRMRSVFEMVGLNGLNRVILLVEDASKGVKEASYSTKTTISIFEESLNIIKSVEVYIKQLLDGSLDQPTRFFDKYKKLGEIIDIEVDIKDLFRPKLEVTDPKLKNELKIGQYLTKNNEEDIKQGSFQAVQKISNYLPVILEKISKYNNLNDAEDMVEYKHACKVVYDSLTDLQTLKLSKSYYVLSGIQKLLLCICAPFFNENFKSLALSNLTSMKVNIALIEETASKLNDGIQSLQLGKKTSSVKINEDVVTENLFFVINAIIQNPKLKEMPVFKELEAYFAYEFYEEQLSSETIQATITYQNSGLSEQLEEILFNIKEELVIITGKKHNEDAYNQHVSKFYVLNYKFWEVLKAANGELNFKSFSNSLVELSEKLKSKKITINEEIKKELSISVVWLEYAINNLIKKRIEQKVRHDFEKQIEIQEKRIRKLTVGESIANLPVPILDARSKEQEARKAVLKIYEEVEKDLKIAEETLEAILRSQSLEDKDLEVVLKPLNSIKGILLVLGNRDMGDLVKELMRIWKCVQQNGLDSIPESELKKSVVWFAGLSLFVTASRDNNEYKSKEIEAKLMLDFKGSPEKVVVKAAELIIPDTNNVSLVNNDDSLSDNTEQQKFVKNTIEKPTPIIEENTKEIFEPIIEKETAENHEIELDNLINELDKPELKSNKDWVFETSQAEDEELKEIFVEEVESLAVSCQEALEILSKDPSNHAEAVTIRRVFHTYKGSGRMIGVHNLGEVAWTAEQEMNKIVARDDIKLTPEQLNAIKKLNEKFIKWAKELNVSNEVTISIAQEQEIFLNDFLGQNQIRGEEPSVISLVEPTYEEKEEIIQTIQEEKDDEVISLVEPTYEEKEEIVQTIQEEKDDEVISLVEPTYEEKEEIIQTIQEEKDDKEVISLVEPTYEEKEEIIQTIQEEKDDDEVISLVEPTYEEKEEEIIQTIQEEKDDEEVISLVEPTYEEKEEEIVTYVVNKLDDEEVIVPPIVDNFDDEEVIVPPIVDNLVDDEEIIIPPVMDYIEEKEEVVPVISKEIPAEEIKELEEDEIYNLCQIEIQDNLNKLQKISSSELLTSNEQYEFMRFAHTLSSLGKTCNLNNMAEVAHRIEIIGEVMLEKNKSLDETNRNEVIKVVSKLREQSTKNNEPSEKDLQQYFITLAAVKNTLIEDSFGSTEINNRLKELEKAVQEKTISVEIPKELINVPEDIKKLNERIDEQKQAIELINNSINKINSELQDLTEKTSKIKREAIGRLKSLKEEVAALKEPVKKKSNGSDFWNFQEITIQENSELKGIDDHFHNVISVLSSMEFDDEKKDEIIEILNSFTFSLEAVLIILEQKELNEIINEVKPVENQKIVEINEKNNSDTINIVSNSENELDTILSNSIILDIFEEKISVIEDEYEEEMFEIAQDEINEKKQQIEEILENTISNTLDQEINAEIKRHLHTLKGNLRMAGLNKMGAIAHRLESVLDFTENRNISLLVVKPIIESELVKLKFLENNLNGIPKDKEEWLDNLAVNRSAIITEETKTFIDIKEDELKVIPQKPIQAIKVDDKNNQIKMAAKTLEDLFNDAGEMRLSRIVFEGTIANHKKHLADMRAASKKMSSLLRELEIQAETQIAAKKEMEAELGGEFDPLEFDRYTRLQELTRFMNEALADIEDGLVDLNSIQKLQENTTIQQTIVTNNILNSIMHVRLIAVDSINERLYRISRNTSKELSKLVVLDISGEKTEIDRFVLEKMFDPLAHILRNCIAHGIESPEKRELLGKNKVGKISLDIKQDGNFIIMTVSDDGAGINLEKVKEKAIEKGLITAHQKLTDDEIIDLIYRSGFSTADEVSQVSGRGVGMDVVKSEILGLGGNIKTTSKAGKGTVFRIVLPVSVATNQVLISTTMSKLIAIPAILIEQVVSIKEADIEQAYKNGKILIGDSEIELNYMGHLNGVLGYNQAPKLNPYNTVVIISQGDERLAIHLDKLETTEEILIKPVGPYFGKIKGLLGATLLGDGRQGLVVNPILLKEHYKEMMKQESSNLSANVETVIRVLVVDDANTVRRTTEKILKKHGFEVFLAVDGANALEILQDIKPDIILSDIEMPVMNGFDLLKSLKVSTLLKEIPVIMITSRTADKHRQMAFDLGCDGFLGKPYLEEELIENIYMLVKR